MILIQAILVVAFVMLVARFLANPDSHLMKAWQKILGIVFFFLAIAAVLLPDSLNHVAHAVGVGRGADLLLYVLTMAFVFVAFNSYVKEKQGQRRLAVLVRRLAIVEANSHPHNVDLDTASKN
jgi:hypothetical protein